MEVGRMGVEGEGFKSIVLLFIVLLNSPCLYECVYTYIYRYLYISNTRYSQ